MRKDEWLKRKYGDPYCFIEQPVLHIVTQQWVKSGFNPNSLLDERNNWYIPPLNKNLVEYEIQREQNLWWDLTEKYENNFNGGINPENGEFFTKSDAESWIAEQYMRRYVPFNLYDGANIINKNIPVIFRIPVCKNILKGWGPELTKKVKEISSRALAFTILHHCERYIHGFTDVFPTFEEYIEDAKMDYAEKQYDLAVKLPEPPPVLEQRVYYKGKWRNVLIPLKHIRGDFYSFKTPKGKSKHGNHWVGDILHAIFNWIIAIFVSLIPGAILLWLEMPITAIVVTLFCGTAGIGQVLNPYNVCGENEF